MQKKKYNIIYNNDKSKGFGIGYYLIFENHEKKPTLDTYYPTWQHNENVDAISVGIINKIKWLEDIGYKLDIYYNTSNGIDNIF